MKEREDKPLVVRPYQLLCTVCSLGGPLPNDCRLSKVERIKAAIRENPDRPITLAANVGDLYTWQDPGFDEDTPEGGDYNRKRDLDILERLNWPPGTTLPARTVFKTIFPRKRRPPPIPTTDGICAYSGCSDPGWEGCPKAWSGDYEKGLQMGVSALIPPRAQSEMDDEKVRSIEVMESAEVIKVRPHLLLCSVCQHGADVRPPFAPDNLPEFLQMVLTKKPNVLVQFVRQADWMMCAPCPHRVPGSNSCANVHGSGGLSNEKRDLDVLQRLGLHFGSIVPAKELYRLIFDRVTTSMSTCKRDTAGPTSVWWDSGCGDPNPETRHKLFEKGREELLPAFQNISAQKNSQATQDP